VEPLTPEKTQARNMALISELALEEKEPEFEDLKEIATSGQ
jgi:hypothetical protein